MAAEPTLDVMTKLRLGAFASEMAAKHPAHAKTIFNLQETLEQRLPLDVQNKIIEKLNKDPKGTLAEAGKLIEKDPSILDAVNKDPLKLAAIMGVDAKPAPVAAAQAAPAKPQAATPPATAANAPVAPAKPEAKPAVQQPAPVAVAAAPAQPISDQELALRKKLGDESAEITRMPGFEQFAERAKDSQSLTQAMNAMMGKDTKNAADALKALEEIRQDPQFFVKANQAIDQVPENMRENVFSSIAENPPLGRAALKGDQSAKMQLMMGSMFKPGGQGIGGLFSMMLGGGGQGGFDLGNMFGGSNGALGAIGNILASILKGAMDMFAPAFAKLSGSTALQAYGPGGGALLASHSRTVDRAMGTDSSQKPVYDATKPGSEPVPMSQLGKDQPKPDAAQPVPARPELAQLDQKKVQPMPGMPHDPTAFA